eukprot:5684414-Amphidinium_carterae.1
MARESIMHKRDRLSVAQATERQESLGSEQSCPHCRSADCWHGKSFCLKSGKGSLRQFLQPHDEMAKVTAHLAADVFDLRVAAQIYILVYDLSQLPKNQNTQSVRNT